MFAGEGQAQHWMKTANWESPKQSLEFQLSQPPAFLYDQARMLYDQARTMLKGCILPFQGLSLNY